MTKRSAEQPVIHRSRHPSTASLPVEKEVGEGEVLCIIIIFYLVSYFILYLLLA